jgi:hypothetical protein
MEKAFLGREVRLMTDVLLRCHVAARLSSLFSATARVSPAQAEGLVHGC